MATGDLVTTCNYHPSVEELLSMIAVRHDDGRVGIRVVNVTADTAVLSDYIDCAKPGPADLSQLLADLVRLDACGKPALFLFTCTP